MPDFDIVDLAPQPIAVVRGKVAWADLPAVFNRGFTEVFAAVTAQGAQMAGAPIGFYPTPPGDLVEVEVGVPVAEPITTSGDVVPSQLPGGRVAHTVHVGGYDTLPRTYEALRSWVAGQGLTVGTSMWEIYVDNPVETTDPTTIRTEVFWTVAD